MGNENCCASERKIKKSAFTETEKAVLKDLYQDVAARSSSKGKSKISADGLASLFPENPELANLLIPFFQANAKDKELDIDAFEASLEILIKEPTDFQLKEYRSMEKIDVLALLISGDYETSKEELKYAQINQKEAIQFAKTILRIFNTEKSDAPTSKKAKSQQQLDDSTVNNLVDQLFSNNEKVTWWTLITYTKTHLIFINRALKFYWTNKFLKTSLSIKLPAMNQDSKVLNKESLGLIFLSNQFFQAITNVNIIYSSMVGKTTIREVAAELCKIKAPHIILLKFTGQGNGSKGNSNPVTGIVGGFSRIAWEDGAIYGGDSDCYITQFVPKFRNYFASLRANSGNNFTYLNTTTTGKPIGLGFGGEDLKGFRFFWDGRDPSNSYVNDDDNNYDTGSLFEGASNKITVDYVEIWSFGSEYTLFETKKIERKSVANPALSKSTFIDPKDLEFKPTTSGNSTTQNETDDFIQTRLSQMANDWRLPTYERRTQIVRTHEAFNLNEPEPEPEPILRSEPAENVVFTEDFEDSGKEKTKKSGKPHQVKSGKPESNNNIGIGAPPPEQRYSKHAYIKTSRNFEYIEVGDKTANYDRKSAILLNNNNNSQQRIQNTQNDSISQPKGGQRSTIGGYYDPFKQQKMEYSANNVSGNSAGGMAQDF